MNRAAAVLFWVTAVGFGMFVPSGIVHLVRHGEPLQVLGFPAYSSGLVERFGIGPRVALLGVFLAVCVAEAVAGWLIWKGQMSGAVLGLALLPFGAAFWIVYALPIPPLVAVVRTVLLIAGWEQLT